MPFPVFQVPFFGNGWVIGMNAVLHVLVSHGVAIGLLAIIILGDAFAVASSGEFSESWGSLNKRMLKFSVIAVTVVGAVTGAGIWFTTSALSPWGTSSMLRIFFWPWFIEWIVFVIEGAILLLFYSEWDKWANRRTFRLLAGATYLGVVFASAVLITGILGFMLTPGTWLSDRSFWTAFLNPTFLPQLATRIFLSLVLGSLLSTAFVLFGRFEQDFRVQALRLFTLVYATSAILLIVSLIVYFALVPRVSGSNAGFSLLTGRFTQLPWLLTAVNGAGALVLVIYGTFAFLGKSTLARSWVFPALLVFSGMVGEFERIREFIRGPYLMPGYMYANGILFGEQALLARDGFAANDPWTETVRSGSHRRGAHVFSRACSACHTIGGLNDIRARFRDRSLDGVFVMLGHLQELVSFMPPLSATIDERRELAEFIYGLSNDNIKMLSLSRHIPVENER